MISSCLGILYFPFSHDPGPEIFTDEARGVQVNFSAEDFTEFEFKTRQPDQPDPCAGLELHENVHIAVRAEVITQHRAKQGQPLNPVFSAEFDKPLPWNFDSGPCHIASRLQMVGTAFFASILMSSVINSINGKYLRLPILSREHILNRLFGKERFMEVIRGACEKTAEEIVDACFRAVREFRGGLPIEDDITLVVVKKT
jgi:hypothetical protein